MRIAELHHFPSDNRTQMLQRRSLAKNAISALLQIAFVFYVIFNVRQQIGCKIYVTSVSQARLVGFVIGIDDVFVRPRAHFTINQSTNQFTKQSST